jgi:hypothetical protein
VGRRGRDERGGDEEEKAEASERVHGGRVERASWRRVHAMPCLLTGDHRCTRPLQSTDL